MFHMRMPSTRMCDKSTRTWCCRIMLVFTVLGVLSTMLFQIWSYYFSLVKQMDEQTISRPEVLSFAHVCESVKYLWNAQCEKTAASGFKCTFFNPENRLIYVDQTGAADVSTFENSVQISQIAECVRLTVWAIPW